MLITDEDREWIDTAKAIRALPLTEETPDDDA